MNDRYSKLVELYKEWNEKINVISRKDIDNVYAHHVVHSLAIAQYLKIFYGEKVWREGDVTILDVGTGGGFPGVPLAMEFPEASFTLCDSIGKKIKVASSVAEAMGLANVTCVNARVESLPQTFDWIVSRAVTSLENFYPWVEGKFNRSILYLKGGNIEEEISNLLKKSHLKRENIRVWSLSEWQKDDYFAEKFVIEIGKDYLCPPKSKIKKIE